MRTALASVNDAWNSDGDGFPLVARRSCEKWIVPVGFTATYVVFAVTVHLRSLDNLDVAVRDAARPGDVRGRPQILAARLVGALQPAHLALLLLLAVTALSRLRRSLRPFWAMAVVGAPLVLVTFGTKRAMRHWDPGTFPVAHGSFPSGHMVTAVSVVGVVVLLARPSTHWGGCCQSPRVV